MYASVVLDRVADALDRTFTYSVPAGMDVRVGQQVRVPLGKTSAEGFIVEITSQCEISPDRVRPILSARPAGGALSAEMIALAGWVRTRYNCNLIEALRLMLPPQMRTGSVRERAVRMARLAQPCPQVRGPRQQELVARLREGDAPASALNASALRALVERGAVEIYQQSVRRAPRALSGETLPDPPLTRAQERAVSEVCSALARGGGRFLFHGVTG